jgi:hypothetical protein
MEAKLSTGKPELGKENLFLPIPEIQALERGRVLVSSVHGTEFEPKAVNFEAEKITGWLWQQGRMLYPVAFYRSKDKRIYEQSVKLLEKQIGG